VGLKTVTMIEREKKAGDAFDPVVRQLLFWIGVVICLAEEGRD
jgi:hypothetical protein